MVRFLVHFIKIGFDLYCIDQGVYAEEWKIVMNGKAVGMMDWRNAGHVEKVSMSLGFCTRAYPLEVDIWFNATTWISSDLDMDNYSSAAKARTPTR
jgi:hypothetical protein